MRRGNETREHLCLKKETGDFLASKGFLVEYEKLDADVLAINPITGGILAVEIERSPRNALRNATRDFKHGAHNVILRASNERVRKCLVSIALKLPEIYRRRTFVCDSTDFASVVFRIFQ